MVLGILFAVGIPFLLPIITLVMHAKLRARMRDLEGVVDLQQRSLGRLEALVEKLQKVEPKPAPPAPVVGPPPVAAPTPAATPPTPPPTKPVAPPPTPVAPPPVAPPPKPVAPAPKPVLPPPVPTAPQPSAAAPPPKPLTPPPAITQPAAAAPSPPQPPRRAKVDLEQFVGVKLFSAIAGVALVLAAVFFLRYSVQQGWLSPPVRVAIGILTGIALLVVCELRAARRYPATANALDAAGVAILFATFFAAHALWNLISAAVAFALLAMVTAVAVLLSIRRESRFIAVLGLLGGFATPALLSTGENRPIPLFAYVLLLNIGLAWVAVRTRWTILTILTLLFTTLYQWGWVVSFLTVNQLSLAMGIFIVFAIAGVTTAVFGRRVGDGTAGGSVHRAGLASAVMPLAFAIYLAAVPAYAAKPELLFGFLFIVAAGLLALSAAAQDEWPHAVGALATVLVFAIWLGTSASPGAWTTVLAFVSAFVVLFAVGPVIAERFGRSLPGKAGAAVFAAPILLYVFPVIAGVEFGASHPARLFGALFGLLAIISWRALAMRRMALYFLGAFFAVATEASWSASHLTTDHLRTGVAMYAAFAVFYLGVPLLARRLGRPIAPSWGGGAVLLASLLLLTFVASGDRSIAALWGLGLLLAILNAGVFIESASAKTPPIAVAGGVLSWFVLAIWWGRAAGAVGVMPSLLVLVMLTLVMLAGHAAGHRTAVRRGDALDLPFGFRQGTYLALLGQVFLFFVASDPQWSIPPWPLFGALLVMTLATSATSVAVRAGQLHAAGVVAAAIVVWGWSNNAPKEWQGVAIAAAEMVAAYAVVWIGAVRRQSLDRLASIGAIVALLVTELSIVNASSGDIAVSIVAPVHVVNLSLICALAWTYQWPWAPVIAVAPAWFAADMWQTTHPAPAAWSSTLALAFAMYAVFSAYPFVLGARSREAREPYFAAIAGAVFFFFTARGAFVRGGYEAYVGIVPVAEGLVMVALLRQLLRLQTAESRDLGRLALVAATALALATVAIPLQLKHQWITIGWALEGAALAWTYRRIPHKGLLYWSFALFAVVFARLALNSSIFFYEPRGYRVFNWYLYAYFICAVAMFVAAWWFSRTEDRILPVLPRASTILPVAGVVLLFILLNIEIADYYATGPEITFRFGVTVAQDLTYTIGWLAFGMGLLGACIYLHNRAGRIAAVTMIAVTAFKAFLYDLGSLGGLYRVGSLIGLAVSLSLVALALQKFVLQESHSE